MASIQIQVQTRQVKIQLRRHLSVPAKMKLKVSRRTSAMKAILSTYCSLSGMSYSMVQTIQRCGITFYSSFDFCRTKLSGYCLVVLLINHLTSGIWNWVFCCLKYSIMFKYSCSFRAVLPLWWQPQILGHLSLLFSTISYILSPSFLSSMLLSYTPPENCCCRECHATGAVVVEYLWM